MAHDFAKAFYTSLAWRCVRKEVLRRDLYSCRECFGNRASEVHHIIPLDATNINDPMIALNPDNLVSLCWLCHQKITKGYTGDVDATLCFNDEGQVIKI